ncbi:MAG: TonB-dependent receptor [Thiobacillus sp.]
MLRTTLLVAALAAAFPAVADPDLNALRAEIQALKSNYEARIQALETRLQQTENVAPVTSPTADAAPVQSAGNRFNPDISLILQGGYTHLGKGDKRRITGFMPADHDSTPTRGFSLNGTELVMSASIDPSFRGHLIVALQDEAAEVEEAWFQTTRLGNGFSLKGGRFRSGLGYQNEKHPHAWDFADNTLMYRALFGEAYGNDGLQLKWVAPTELFMELGAETGRGANFPGTDRNRNGVGSVALFGHLGGDVGASHSWRGGLSYLQTQARDREASLDDLNAVEGNTLFSGKSKTWVADFVWKWAPEGNASERSFKFSTEYFLRNERGTLLCQDNTSDFGKCDGTEGAYRTQQSGLYTQGVYQFMPRWRTGYRYDRLNTGSVDFGSNNASLNAGNYSPIRHSLMLDYSPSEFSRLRLQYSKDKSMQGLAENQWFVQYVHSLGSHGAHTF